MDFGSSLKLTQAALAAVAPDAQLEHPVRPAAAKPAAPSFSRHTACKGIDVVHRPPRVPGAMGEDGLE